MHALDEAKVTYNLELTLLYNTDDNDHINANTDAINTKTDASDQCQHRCKQSIPTQIPMSTQILMPTQMK